MSVTEYLERARDCAVLAEKMQGEDKAKLLAIADAWLELADEAAKKAAQSGDRAAGAADPPGRPRRR